MQISGDLSVFIGAILIWCVAAQSVGDALVAFAQGRWAHGLFYAACAFGAFSVGWQVWKAA